MQTENEREQRWGMAVHNRRAMVVGAMRSRRRTSLPWRAVHAPFAQCTASLLSVSLLAVSLLAVSVLRSHAQTAPPPKPTGQAARELAAIPRTPVPQIPDAGTSATYTLAQLIDMGERANPQTRTAWELTKQAANETIIARSSLFPTLALTTTALRGDLLFGLPPNISSDGVVKLNSTIVEPAVKLTWTALDFGANLATYRAAKETEAATREEATGTEQQVALTISQDYYALVAAGQAQQSANASYAAAKIDLASSELSYANGLISVIKRDQTRAQALSTYASLVSAKAKFQQAKVALAAEVNLKAAQSFDVPPLGNEIDTRWVNASVQQLVQTAYQRRPELHEALDQIKAAQQEERSAHAGLFPTVSLTAQEQYTYSTSSSSAANNALTMASSPNTNGNTYVVSANLNWDIFTAGAKRARVRYAASQVRQSQLHLDQLTLDVQAQVWQSYTDVEAALDQQAAAEASLLASRENFDSAKLANANGLGNEVPLTTAQASLAQAESAYTSARTNTLQLAAKLAYSTGQLLSFGPMIPRPIGGKP